MKQSALVVKDQLPSNVGTSRQLFRDLNSGNSSLAHSLICLPFAAGHAAVHSDQASGLVT